MAHAFNRREFIASSTALSAAYWVGGKSAKAQDRSANEKVRYACIGVGGKGSEDSSNLANLGEIVGICDTDKQYLTKAGSQPGFRDAKKFSDFREMLENLGDKIDGVSISTPDHTHAPAAALALKKKLAVYLQKPLTHTVWEARRLTELSKEHGSITQMGNQGTTYNALRHAAALLKTGLLGKIKEVHVTTNRPVWPQGGARPAPSPKPPFLDWDLWLGPAPEREYSEGYHPFSWRGYWDFGTGALGDMACHTFNMPYAGLNLANPKTVQAWSTGHNRDSFPQASKIKFEFTNPSATEELLPVWWYDGGNVMPAELLHGTPLPLTGDSVRGTIIVGENLTMFGVGDYSEGLKLYDNEGKEVPVPEAEYDVSPGIYAEFHQGITGERKDPSSNFATYSGPLTETILIGNLALFDAAEGESRKLEWDSENLTVPNAPELQKIVNKEYRGDWGKDLL